jgi:hypothetical protein
VLEEMKPPHFSMPSSTLSPLGGSHS